MWDSIISFLQRYYLAVLIGIIYIVKVVLSGGKFEEYPGNKVVAVTSIEMWNSIIADPANKGKLMVIDFYATWCPPCRAASPVYGKMSIDFEDVLFLKVDVDAMSTLMRECNVRAMPTFQLYKDRQQLEQVVGFQESKLRRTIEKHRQEQVVVSDPNAPSKDKET